MANVQFARRAGRHRTPGPSSPAQFAGGAHRARGRHRAPCSVALLARLAERR
jgi:hypothetical protein